MIIILVMILIILTVIIVVVTTSITLVLISIFVMFIILMLISLNTRRTTEGGDTKLAVGDETRFQVHPQGSGSFDRDTTEQLRRDGR